MTAANYQACLDITLDYEGGYSNDPGDPGGPTKYGITIIDVRQYLNPNATAADVKALTLEQAKTIYEQHYWKPVVGDAWPDGPDLCVFDAGVNSGIGRARPWAVQALGVNDPNANTTFAALAGRTMALPTEGRVAFVKRYQAIRLGFLHGLRTWSIFGRGWGSRVAGIESLGVKMVLKAASVPADEVKTRLEREGKDAQSASNQATTGAVVTTGGGGGGGGSQIPWDHMTTSKWIAVGVVGVMLVIAIAAMVHWAIAHRQRANAYAAAAATP